ncbi:response regulator [Paraflavisolibacter sp. H34]|uniref:response regulator transcription factor n=1 Tax=Huijunlia imazamoxiresistens TaxID=3127457 RepID=UPI00301A85E2
MKPVLLLVDDHPEMLEVLADELGEKYEIRTAPDGRQALELLRQEAVHLVVSDVMMPVMDGFELCRAIKSNFEYSHVPVILLTAKNTLQSKIEGLEQGADAYIEKPFDSEYLLVQIANLLANRNKIKEYFAHSPLVHLKSIAPTRPDESFLDKLNEVIRAHMEDVELDVDQLARLMTMSRTSLFRKIKSITDLTPNELINLTRLKKAAELLAAGTYKIYEVSDMVGYSSHTNFGRNFQKQFGMTPKEYQKQVLSGGGE